MAGPHMEADVCTAFTHPQHDLHLQRMMSPGLQHVPLGKNHKLSAALCGLLRQFQALKRQVYTAAHPSRLE